jgi:Spy/CpxP family protein refolding chaperone
MHWLRLVVPAIGLSLFLGSPAYGQFFMSKLGRGSGPSQLLLREEVQKELGLTPEQIKQVKDINDEIRAGLDQEFVKLSTLTGRDRDRKKQELGTRIKERARSSVKKIITPEQHRRLDEIALQAAGVQGFKEERVETELALTREQKAQIQNLMQEGIMEIQQFFKNTLEEYEKSQKRAAEIRDQTYDKALAVLTPDQRKKWEEMQGKPFEFRIIEQRRPLPLAIKGEIPLPPEAMPSADRANLEWVEVRAEKWQPQPEEKRFNEIGWADSDILTGLKLAQKHHRPLFVFLVDGFSHRGRC